MIGERNSVNSANTPLRILVADDSDEFRNVLEQFLKQLRPASVVGIVEDGLEVLTEMASTRPDLVLLDLRMPQLNGLQAARKIRTDYSGVRVIIITLYDSAELKAASMAAGADQCIPKHRLRDELPGAIARLFPDS
jgi:DNA-binding NarL/FixJ family response regulator